MRSLSMSFMYIAFLPFVLGLPKNILAQDGQPPDLRPVAVNQAATATAPSVESIAASQLPDSPGTLWAQAQDASPQQTASPQSGSTPPNQTGSAQTPADQDQSQKPQRPVGTAAAEAPTVSGVTAAQPAGFAIAPAKQRRVRTLVLKVGAIVGAGVAVGSVIALTAATSSKPPGAR
jgi:hypothetical protein